MFPRELQLLLERNGLRIEHLYGNYDGSAITPDSPRIIASCARAGNLGIILSAARTREQSKDLAAKSVNAAVAPRRTRSLAVSQQKRRGFRSAKPPATSRRPGEARFIHVPARSFDCARVRAALEMTDLPASHNPL